MRALKARLLTVSRKNKIPMPERIYLLLVWYKFKFGGSIVKDWLTANMRVKSCQTLNSCFYILIHSQCQQSSRIDLRILIHEYKYTASRKLRAYGTIVAHK